MASWDTMQTELPTLFADLLGLPCDWSDQPRRMQSGAHAGLDILAPTGIGVDQVQWSVAEIEGAPAVSATVIGLRELTLQVSVWSPKQMLGGSARRYLERMRTRLRLPSTLARLAALGLAHVRTEDLVDLDPTEDSRVQSQSSVDVRLAFLATEVDDEATPVIETALVSSDDLRLDTTVELT